MKSCIFLLPFLLLLAGCLNPEDISLRDNELDPKYNAELRFVEYNINPEDGNNESVIAYSERGYEETEAAAADSMVTNNLTIYLNVPIDETKVANAEIHAGWKGPDSSGYTGLDETYHFGVTVQDGNFVGMQIAYDKSLPGITVKIPNMGGGDRMMFAFDELFGEGLSTPADQEFYLLFGNSGISGTNTSTNQTLVRSWSVLGSVFDTYSSRFGQGDMFFINNIAHIGYVYDSAMMVYANVLRLESGSWVPKASAYLYDDMAYTSSVTHFEIFSDNTNMVMSLRETYMNQIHVLGYRDGLTALTNWGNVAAPNSKFSYTYAGNTSYLFLFTNTYYGVLYNASPAPYGSFYGYSEMMGAAPSLPEIAYDNKNHRPILGYLDGSGVTVKYYNATFSSLGSGSAYNGTSIGSYDLTVSTNGKVWLAVGDSYNVQVRRYNDGSFLWENAGSQVSGFSTGGLVKLLFSEGKVYLATFDYTNKKLYLYIWDESKALWNSLTDFVFTATPASITIREHNGNFYITERQYNASLSHYTLTVHRYGY